MVSEQASSVERGPQGRPSTSDEVEAILAAAASAVDAVRGSGAQTRAVWLNAVAQAIEASTEQLVEIAAAETHLPEAALRGELVRTAFQLRHCAEAGLELADRQIAEAADPDYPAAPRPALVRLLVPLGPVLVFTASNFPFAFSVAGNDMASALAAGCPVIVKANSGHPRLSEATAAVVSAALEAAGAPRGTFGHLSGREAGLVAIRDPRVAACGFTGSLGGGRALFDLACSRPEPIPFYGELGSVNPVYVTPAADRERAGEIATGFAGSFTFRGGQLCTKPGVLAVPAGSMIPSLTVEAISSGATELLTERIAAAYTVGVERLAEAEGARVLARGDGTAPFLVVVSAADVVAGRIVLDEIFGPASVVVEYDSPGQMLELAAMLPASLTATIQGEATDSEGAALVPVLTRKAGRLIWNQWPTGVCVTAALHHGGPYPATTVPTYGSIGATSLERWVRPVTFQNWPSDLLPG